MYTKPDRLDPARLLLLYLLAGVLLAVLATAQVSGYIITASSGPHGNIYPPGANTVPPGGSISFIIFDTGIDPGYHLDSLIIDGIQKPPNPMYTFSNVSADHTIQATFAQDTGSLDINSNPRHATIFIDGTESGQTPQVVSPVPVGSHQLRLSLAGYQDYTTMVLVTADTKTNVPQVNLVPVTVLPTTTVPTTTVPTTSLPPTTIPTSSPTSRPTTAPTTSPVTTVVTTTIQTTTQTSIPTTIPTTVPVTTVTTVTQTQPVTILPEVTDTVPLITTLPTIQPSASPTSGVTPITVITPVITPGNGNTGPTNIVTPPGTVTTRPSQTPATANVTGVGPEIPRIPSVFTQSNVFRFLLIMIIPLGLLLAHDYFGLRHLSFPQPLVTRIGVAAGQLICAIGLVEVLYTLMSMIPGLTDPLLLPLVLIVMLFMAYLVFSAIALAAGSVLSRPLRWTLKVHVIIGVIVLVIAPIILFWLSNGSWKTILITLAAAPVTTLLALWQNHSLALRFQKSRYPWEGFLNGDETTVPAGTDPFRRSVATRPDMFPPELADRYTSVDFLGKGGLSHVFRAMRLKDGKTVAVKIPIRFDETTGKCFMKEIVAWEGLRHPNIVEITEVNILPLPYVEMEYVKSGLADLKTPLPVDQAAELVKGVANGLAYAHEQGIIHRDIKPQNILVTNEGVPKITDWGMSRLIGSSAMPTVTGFSLAYASPEQISPGRFGDTDERTDIYQLGVVFYELVTGKPLFPGNDLADVSNSIISRTPVPPSEINPEAGPLDDIIMRCLKKDPKERYQSVRDLIKDLDRFLSRNDVVIQEGDLWHNEEGEI